MKIAVTAGWRTLGLPCLHHAHLTCPGLPLRARALHVPGPFVHGAQKGASFPAQNSVVPLPTYPIRPQLLLEKPALPSPSSAGHWGLPRPVHLPPELKLPIAQASVFTPHPHNTCHSPPRHPSKVCALTTRTLCPTGGGSDGCPSAGTKRRHDRGPPTSLASCMASLSCTAPSQRGLWTLRGLPPPLSPLLDPAAFSVTPGSWQQEPQVENTKGFLRLER